MHRWWISDGAFVCCDVLATLRRNLNRMRVLNAVALCALAAAVLLASPAAAFPDAAIRCKVCERAVHYVWHKGVELRGQCLHGATDDRCDFHHVHPWAINQMVWGVCTALPETHQAIMKSEFEIVLHDTPEHTAENVRAIKQSCLRWLHSAHGGAEEVGRIVMGNLEVGKKTEVILEGLTSRFCTKACQAQDDGAGDL
jgi:hypothetical protein